MASTTASTSKNNKSILLLCGIAVVSATFLFLSSTNKKKNAKETDESGGITPEKESSPPDEINNLCLDPVSIATSTSSAKVMTAVKSPESVDLVNINEGTDLLLTKEKETPSVEGKVNDGKTVQKEEIPSSPEKTKSVQNVEEDKQTLPSVETEKTASATVKTEVSEKVEPAPHPVKREETNVHDDTAEEQEPASLSGSVEATTELVTEKIETIQKNGSAPSPVKKEVEADRDGPEKEKLASSPTKEDATKNGEKETPKAAALDKKEVELEVEVSAPGDAALIEEKSKEVPPANNTPSPKKNKRRRNKKKKNGASTPVSSAENGKGSITTPISTSLEATDENQQNNSNTGTKAKTPEKTETVSPSKADGDIPALKTAPTDEIVADSPALISAKNAAKNRRRKNSRKKKGAAQKAAAKEMQDFQKS